MKVYIPIIAIVIALLAVNVSANTNDEPVSHEDAELFCGQMSSVYTLGIMYVRAGYDRPTCDAKFEKVVNQVAKRGTPIQADNMRWMIEQVFPSIWANRRAFIMVDDAANARTVDAAYEGCYEEATR